ncbi:MAG: potassium/proton antiporter [Bacteroidota bacterium]
MSIEYIFIIGASLILASVAIAKLSDNLGVPTLLLFLGIGMLAGSEGLGGIYFDDAGLAQSIGIICLVVILFAGGMDTNWREVRPVFWQATGLATFGTLLTALAVGLFAIYVLNFSLVSGLLLGAVVSSTDASAVFSVLRSKNVSLRGQIKPLLELESGSNDPMAVFLTIGIIQFFSLPGASIGPIVLLFVVQMSIGALFGLAMGKTMVVLINHLRLSYEGIYPVFSFAFAGLIYGVTAAIGGSGFLAVYVAGLVAGNSEFVHKKSSLRFFDGLAWLSQIAMFLTLGLLVFPSNILPVVGVGLLAAGFLILVARPLSVFLSLLFTKLNWKEKTLISWVGLRGAVPIILATFPLLAGVPGSASIFNIVFFIVLTSTLLQGWTLPFAARLLHLDAPMERKKQYPIEFAPLKGVDTELVDLMVPFNSEVTGKSIIELGMPQDSLIVLISRDDSFIIPSGGTILQEGDTILVLVNKSNLPAIRGILQEQRRPALE